MRKAGGWMHRLRHGRRVDNDETMVMIDGSGGEGGENSPSKRRGWRDLPMGTWEPLLNKEQCLADVMVVFPAGIFLQMASNANDFHVELIIEAPPLQKRFSVVVPPSGAIYDIALMEAPKEGGPRSNEWCSLFGIITRENLSQGIVERREDGSLVVWRTFRTKPSDLTPFGLYFAEKAHRISTAGLMVIENTEFEDILRESCGARACDVKIMAKPLLDEDKHKGGDNPLPIHIEVRAPVVLTVPPPPIVTINEESYM